MGKLGGLGADSVKSQWTRDSGPSWRVQLDFFKPQNGVVCRVLLLSVTVNQAERVVVALRWSRVAVVASRWSRVAGGGVAVVAGCCLSFKVRDGWSEIRVEKGLGFCVFLLGCCKSVFLIGLAAHLFFLA